MSRKSSKKMPGGNLFPIFTSGENVSYWVDSSPGMSFSPLSSDITVETVIVGAGIAGVTTAYLLAKAGHKIALIDDGNIGSGETGRTTAHLVSAIDDRFYDLQNYFGTEKARLAAESHSAAVDRIERIVQEEGIACDFRRIDGYLFLHPTDELKSLEEDLKASQECGLSGVRMIDRAPIDSFNTGTCLHYPQQAQFHPMQYLNALAQKIDDYGGEIYTGTHVSEFDRSGVHTSNGFRVRADHIVVATNTPVNDRVTMHTKQAPYRTYVVALRVPKDSIPFLLLWDTGDQNQPNYPYHYIRLHPIDDSSDLLIVGGEDHKTGQADDWKERIGALEQWTRERFPKSEEVLYRWSGQVMEPIDSLAFIGRNPSGPDNLYICTGDSGNGMTHGTIAGILNTDLILGIENPWASVYDPSRQTLRAASDFIHENINVAKQYADWVKHGDVESVDQLGNGQGAVIKEGGKPLAVYRDESGTLFANSAVCVHLGCIVRWNDEEKTFDCPCHGSRFTHYGEVVNGPANKDLEPAEVSETAKK